MKPFEFTNLRGNKKGRVLIVDDAYILYEQENGTCILNNESVGITYHPEETYEEMRSRIIE